MTIVCDVENQAYPVRARQEKAESKEPGESGKCTPPARLVGKCEKDSDGKSEENMDGAENSTKYHARSVAVECGPSDEVGMRVLAEGAGDDSGGDGECGGVGSMLESVKLRRCQPTIGRECLQRKAYACYTTFLRQIKLSRSSRCQVVSNYPVNL